MRKRFYNFSWSEGNAVLMRGKGAGGMDFLNDAMSKVYELSNGMYWKYAKSDFEELADEYEE